MKYKSIDIKSLFTKIEERTWVLPNFQRDFVWSTDKQKKIIASLFLDYPLGSLLLLENKNKKTLVESRELGSRMQFKPKHSSDLRYVLDGQQRITSLYNALRGVYETSKITTKNWDEQFKNRFYNVNFLFLLNFIKNIKEEIVHDISLNSDKEISNKKDVKNKKTNNEVKIIYPSNRDDYLFGLYDLNFNENECVHVKEVEYFEEFIDVIQIHLRQDSSKIYHPLMRHSKNYQGEMRDFCSKKYSLPTNCFHDYDLLKQILIDIGKNRIDYLDKYDRKLYNRICKRENPEFDINNKNIELEMEIRAQIFTSWQADVSKFLEKLFEREVPYIDEERQEKAYEMFDILNQGGTRLDDYDFLVLTSARKSKENLTKRIESKLHEDFNLGILKSKEPEIQSYTNKEFGLLRNNGELTQNFKERFKPLLSINACYDREEHLPTEIKSEWSRKKSILSLSPNEINNNLERTLLGITRACAFLNFRCGVTSIENIPFKLMLTPLAYCLQKEEIWLNKNKLDLLESWYWTSIFSGYYSVDQNNRSTKDILKLYNLLLKNPAEIVEIDDLETIIGRKLASRVLKSEVEDFVDEVTGELVSVERGVVVLESGTVIKEKNLNDIRDSGIETISLCKQGVSIDDTLTDQVIKSLGLKDRKLKMFKNDFINKDLLLKRSDSDVRVSKSMEKAVLQYVLSREPKDFMPHEKDAEKRANKQSPIIAAWKQTTDTHVYQDHHIIPLGSATSIGESSKTIRADKDHILNSVLNRTLIGKIPNNIISDLAVEDYMKEVHSYSFQLHFIDTTEKNKSQKENEYYQQMLESRFRNISQAVENEIGDLMITL
tara:strand:+ start:6481 stop:8973 length:2493 start_codon:yes stop_codon:yes gene_type:complete